MKPDKVFLRAVTKPDVSDEPITFAILSCMKNDNIKTEKDFLKALKKGVKMWAENNQMKNVYSDEFDFKFLWIYFEQPTLINTLSRFNIVDFTMYMINENEITIDINTKLA